MFLIDCVERKTLLIKKNSILVNLFLPNLILACKIIDYQIRIGSSLFSLTMSMTSG